MTRVRDGNDKCGNLIIFASIWTNLEVMIFYFYILTAIMFILMSNIFGFMATDEITTAGQPSKRKSLDFLDYAKNE